jgi:thiol-disulfide isomerase/thioredoxin
VYNHEDGVYTVKEQDGEYQVTRNNDGSTTVQVIYDGEYEGYVDPIRTRQTCIVANESVQGCTIEVYTTELGWKDINDMSVGSPKNAKSDTQIKQAATDANCSASGNSSEKCNENAAHHPNTVQQTGAKGESYENSESNCEQIKSWWARTKEECDKSNWQTKKCIEIVYFMNGCPINVTVVDPTPDGGMYFGCSGTGDAEILKKACDRKTWVQNSLPDGPVSQAECLNPSDITKISIGFDPCGPEVQPTEEMGCHPPTNVPSETGVRPTPQGNPITAPLFINNNFKTFGEYVQHNQYMHSISLPNNTNSFAVSKKISSKNSFQRQVSKTNTTIVVFYSNKCAPSLNYLSAIQNNLEKIKNNADVYVADVEQNPELIKDYNIQFTPTTIIFKNGQATKIFSGAGKVDELLNL